MAGWKSRISNNSDDKSTLFQLHKSAHWADYCYIVVNPEIVDENSTFALDVDAESKDPGAGVNVWVKMNGKDQGANQLWKLTK